MPLYIAHSHSLIYALIFRMCYRMANLHFLSMEADALRYSHYLLHSLKEVKVFKRRTPSECGFRPWGKNNWMHFEGARPDHRHMAYPFMAMKDTGYATSSTTKTIGEQMASNRRKFPIDPMGLTPGLREELEDLNGGHLDNIDVRKRVQALFGHDKERPHRCSKCASGDHHATKCTTKGLKCVYPRCLSTDHVLATCPVLISRCANCNRLGHHEDHHKEVPWVLLVNDFQASAAFHPLGLFTCERLKATMGLENGFFVALPLIDLSNMTAVTSYNRRLLSVVPYDMPY
jgi:hypothetical protein